MMTMDSSHLLVKMKHFVRGSDIVSTNDKVKQAPVTAFVSGTQAQQFYEKTLGKEALVTPKVKLNEEQKHKKSKPKPDKKKLKVPFNINLFMKMVQNGNTKDVKEMLERNEESVNCQDQFGWTPLMSACCAGNGPMVQMLLEWGADIRLCDKKGNTCRNMAVAQGHKTIVNILNQHSEDIIKPQKNSQDATTSYQTPSDSSTFYCKVCKQTVENTAYKKHILSTIHNFHAASKRNIPTLYGIPESNKGFQILVKSGWNKEDGLGPSGDGHKFPPKTILKQDRTGLGAKRYKARVTHSLEETWEEAKPTNTFKRDFKSEKRKSQRLERSLRRMLT